MTEKDGNHPPEYQERHGNPADSQEKVVKLPELKEVYKGVILDHGQEKTPGITKEQEAPDPGWREQEKKEDYSPQGRQRPKRRHFRSPPSFPVSSQASYGLGPLHFYFDLHRKGGELLFPIHLLPDLVLLGPDFFPNTNNIRL